MSQTTRCPSCGTRFKVVADQLRISEGWVRCGQCQEVFDATLTLDAAAAAPVPAVPAAPVAAVAEQLPAQESGYALPAAVDDEDDLPLAPGAPEFDAQAQPQPSGASEPGAEALPEPEPELKAEPEAVPDLESGPQPPLERQPEVDLDIDLRHESELAPLPLAGAAPDPFARSHGERPPQTEAEPGFMRTARRKAFWQSRGVRAALAAGSTVLLLALALQVALQERNALAAWNPALRPALQGLCALSGCTLSARQDIAQIVITASAFTRTAQEGSYLLTLTIENQASTELAMPAVELTLTDLQDQPVLRRVLLPADLQAPATLGAQAEWSARVPLAVTATPARIAGYRALVFYP
ncbi:DUF3426 domain-containing protein [Comamonas antarctica]|uniref:DUF3426 domain-containing protein n=1 Tax=Comamonas antarctica TaxID=2743470 RepID=UPI0028E214B3|nr:DUF3426 domain-containing protein [Comamonas antarctica]